MSLLALIGLALAAGLIGAGLAGLTITVFLHRGITHGSHRMKPSVYAAGRWLTYFTVFMRHWEWRRIHRKHHLYTDTWIDEIRHDPHSPIVITQREGIDGYRRVSWHMAAIFHAEARLPDIQDGTYDNPQARPTRSTTLDRRVFSIARPGSCRHGPRLRRALRRCSRRPSSASPARRPGSSAASSPASPPSASTSGCFCGSAARSTPTATAARSGWRAPASRRT